MEENFGYDILWLVIFFIAMTLLAKIALFNEPLFMLVKLMSVLFVLIIMPGFSLTYHIKDMIFIERFVIGAILMFAVIGVGSTIFGFFRIQLSVSAIILAVLCYIIGLFFILKKVKNETIQETISQ